jgi:TetR/AcrR family transcriptional regulator, transcriptional repressor for nem operon
MIPEDERMSTRDEIVLKADILIRSRGYNAFSYNDIGEWLNIRPAAIHYYFPSKTDLGLEVIEQELQRVISFQKKEGGRLSSEEHLKRLFHTFFRQSFEPQICLMGALIPEIATFEESMQNRIRELSGAIVEWVGFCLEGERLADRMRFEGTAEDRALLVVSTLLSSLLLARVMGREVFDRMADQLLWDLGAAWRINDLPDVPEDYDEPYSYT